MTAAIGGVSIPSISALGLGGTTSVGSTADVASTGTTQSTSGGDFASVLASSLDQLQATQSNTDNLATQAATGNLTDVSDYMIASNESSLATSTVVALKNQAVSAFNEIMRMQV